MQPQLPRYRVGYERLHGNNRTNGAAEMSPDVNHRIGSTRSGIIVSYRDPNTDWSRILLLPLRVHKSAAIALYASGTVFFV